MNDETPVCAECDKKVKGALYKKWDKIRRQFQYVCEKCNK